MDPAVLTGDLARLRQSLDALEPDPKNARLHSSANVAGIAASLKRFGQDKPLLARHTKMGKLRLIAGHGTLEAMKHLGWKSAAVLVRDDLDWRAARARGLADNRTGELSSWDNEMLLEALKDLDAAELPSTGFTADEVAKLEALANQEEAKADPGKGDDVPIPEAPKRPTAQTGDVWKLGPHRLAVGDFNDPKTIERVIAGARVKQVVTDPPYAIYGSSTGIGADITDDLMVRPFFVALFQLMQSVLARFDVAHVFTDWRSYATLWDAARLTELKVKNAIVWDKGDGGLGSNYANCYELVAYLVRMPPAKAMASNEQKGLRGVFRPNIARFPRVSGADRQHNAAKPVPLLRQLIEDGSKKGDLVLDPCAGSGSTLIAAGLEGRRCATVEIKEATADVAILRWQQLTGEQATLEDTGETFDKIARARAKKR